MVMDVADDLGAYPIRKISLNSLKLHTLIAEGGFAEIYRAASPEGTVAVRILKKQYRFNRRRRQRFWEGVKVRRLFGPLQQVVQYRGEFGGFFSCPGEVIEWIEGSTLRTLMHQGHPVIRTATLDILRQCAAAIMHIHQLGYLHLDIKPENFLVQFENGKPIVKLTDFDLVLPIDQKQAPEKFGGSLMYLPPEYLEKKTVSPAMDIFAFGVLAFHLLTGQPPFVGSVEPMLRTNSYRIVFPDRPAVPDELKDLVCKCLARKPSGRFRSAAELYTTVEQLRIEFAKQKR